jgi:hypothetical protein
MYFMKKVYRMLRRVNNHNRREIVREDDEPYVLAFCFYFLHVWLKTRSHARAASSTPF